MKRRKKKEIRRIKRNLTFKRGIKRKEKRRGG